MLRSPVGALSLNFLIGYSVSLSVFGSNLPMNISPKSEYQTLPSLSTRMSCGSVVRRPMSYSVTMAWVERPVGRAQVYGGEILGHLAVLLGRAGARAVQHRLRLDRLAHRAIAHHAADHDRPLIGVMGRAHDALERVAADAVEQRRLLLLRAGHAHHPFGVGELVGEIVRLLELDVGVGRLLGHHVGPGRRVDVVADRADGELVLARLQPVLREGV